MIDARVDFERLKQVVSELESIIDLELEYFGGRRTFGSAYPFSNFINKSSYLAELGRELWQVVKLQDSATPSGYEEYPNRVIDSNGYAVLWDEGFTKRIGEHRYVVSRHLNRELESTEIVHHKDHDKLNNELDNLVIMSVHDHSSYHGKNRQKRSA